MSLSESLWNALMFSSLCVYDLFSCVTYLRQFRIFHVVFVLIGIHYI
jgi:hypothetical protein